MTSRPPVALAYDEHNAESPVTVVLLHGFPFDRTMWDPQAQELAELGFRVIVPDLRGHGLSPSPDEPATMRRCAADVVALLDRLGVDRFVLAGLSMGGYIALEMYATAAARIDGLVLADTQAGADDEAARAKRVASIDAIRRDGVEAFVDALLPKLLSPQGLATRSVQGHVRLMMLGITAEGATRAVEGLMSRADHQGTLATVRVPTLVVCGTLDTITPPARSRQMADRLPHATLALLEGAGHVSTLEAPDAFNRALVDWLQRLLKGRRA